jgi:putative peptidoglycan lipid II flippase
MDLVYRRGQFRFSDSQATAVYFFWFSLSLALWAAQSLYSRAFYAAGNTLTPMIASTLITLGSIPVYSALYHAFSTPGLAFASDLGILANTVAVALLLHQRKLVPIDGLQWRELGKAAITAVVAGWLSYRIASSVVIQGSRVADIKSLALTTLTWAGAVAAGLWITRSHLLRDLLNRKGTSYPRVAEKSAGELSRGVEP